MEMDHVTFETLYLGISRISAKDTLRGFTISSYPNMKDQDRRKLHKEVYRSANPEAFEQKIVKTTDLELF